MGNGFFKKIWHFIWHDDSLLSWIANFLLAFILVKWVLYPIIGLLLGTSFPIVAVVSGSMEHPAEDFETWWENNKWYQEHNFTADEFATYTTPNGFNKGDIMVLYGTAPKDIKVGDVLVYETTFHSNPIIHRVVAVTEENNEYIFTTKGDNNPLPDQHKVTEAQLQHTGTALFRVPLLGWIKLWFTELVNVWR